MVVQSLKDFIALINQHVMLFSDDFQGIQQMQLVQSICTSMASSISLHHTVATYVHY